MITALEEAHAQSVGVGGGGGGGGEDTSTRDLQHRHRVVGGMKAALKVRGCDSSVLEILLTLALVACGQNEHVSGECWIPHSWPVTNGWRDLILRATKLTRLISPVLARRQEGRYSRASGRARGGSRLSWRALPPRGGEVASRGLGSARVLSGCSFLPVSIVTKCSCSTRLIRASSTVLADLHRSGGSVGLRGARQGFRGLSPFPPRRWPEAPCRS